VRTLREGERLLGEGKEPAEVANALETSGATFHRWRNQYGGMKANDARKLRQLRDEIQRLKRMVADRGLQTEGCRPRVADRDAQGDIPGKLLSPAKRRAAVLHLIEIFGTNERQAYRAVSQPRATQRRPLRPVAAPAELLPRRLRERSPRRGSGGVLGGPGRWC
jgi:hypothetical protein